MTKIWPIAVNAFVQTIRQPIFSILLLAIFGLLVMVTTLTGYSMEGDIQTGDTRLMVDSSLATLMAFAIFLAAFSASAVLSREIESRTVLTVVTKPVPRAVIFLGKLLGVAAAVSLGYYLASAALILNARHGVISARYNEMDWVVITFGFSALLGAMLATLLGNYLLGLNPGGTFVMSATVLFTLALVGVGLIDRHWQATSHFLAGVDPQVFRVLGLIWMAAMIMTTLCVAASTRLNGMATLLLAYAVFGVSLVTSTLFASHAETNLLGRVGLTLAPNLSYFFALDALTTGQTITGRYLLTSAGYAVCYCAGLSLLGMALFQTREMDAREDGASAPMLVNFYAWVLRLVAAGAMISGMAVLGGLRAGQLWALAAAALLGGLLLWALAGAFGRGAAWALWLALSLAVVQLIFSVVVRVVDPSSSLALSANLRFALGALALVNLLYVAVMVSRKATRAHFFA